MTRRHIAISVALLAGWSAAGVFGLVPLTVSKAHAASQQKPAISEDARAALVRMGQTLRAGQLAFQLGRFACIRARMANRFTSSTPSRWS